MFQNLIESGSHTQEFARRSSFFVGTIAIYAVLFLVGGIISIYAYDAHPRMVGHQRTHPRPRRALRA